MATQDAIALRYGLIPSHVTQETMYDFLVDNPQYNYVRDVSIGGAATSSKEKVEVSTSSICSYMSPYTPNKRVALIHSTGTGKTRKSLLAAVQYNRDITLVAVHNIQMVPFVSEMSSEGYLKKKYPWFRKKLDVITCKSVATAVSKGDVRRLDYFFRGRVIIVDEMHHIRSSGEKASSRSSLFDSMVEVLSRYKDSVVFFLTATPLVDKSQELVGIYKLLRPGSEESTNMQYLAHNLRGYVSSLTKQNLPTKRRRVICVMPANGIQWELYQKHQSDKTSVYSRSMAVSRFVTQDDEDASEYAISTQAMLDDMVSRADYETDDEYNEECIRSLRYISVKMYKLVRHLIANRGYPKFIFDAWKKRGGVERIVDVLCLSAVGYRCVTTVAEAMDTTKGPKILALHRLPSSRGYSSIVKELIDIYNSDQNREGELIELLVAAPMFAESMSLKTARECHVMMPPWNTTSRMQISGRINRRSSLRFLSPKDRFVTNYTYILYRPDESPTVESTIERAAKTKYKEIVPLLDIMATSRIESLHTTRPGIFLMEPFPTHNRINGRVRMCKEIVGYREIAVGVEPLLAELETRGNIYSLMEHISSQEFGYTRLINVAIQAIEKLYIDRLLGVHITDKQKVLLDDVSAAFISYEGYHTHVLYFSNDDTVEYQRLAKLKRRIVRALDTSTNIWVDVKDQRTVEVVTEIYEKVTSDFAQTIHSKWEEYGYYATKFLLTSCYRLVRYRTSLEVARLVRKENIDKRKVSRGEKWQYYSKQTLIGLLGKFVPLSRYHYLMLLKRVPIEIIFREILKRMSSEGMLLTLPI